MYGLTLNQETPSSYLSQVLSDYELEHEIKTASAVKSEEVLKDVKSIPFCTLFIEKKEDNEIIGKTKPISLQIYSEGNRFFVENEKLSLFGEGNTTQEAVEDFVIHFNYFYHYYKSLDRNQLMGQGVILKDIYNTIFQKS